MSGFICKGIHFIENFNNGKLQKKSSMLFYGHLILLSIETILPFNIIYATATESFN